VINVSSTPSPSLGATAVRFIAQWMVGYKY